MSDADRSETVKFACRPVRNAEVEDSFKVLSRVAQRLESKGRRQRISKTSLADYRQWQADGVNYAVTDETGILGIFSLPIEGFQAWPMIDRPRPERWLRALATDPAHRNRRVGEFAVSEALRITGAGNSLFLDCVSGFLPRYYQSLGFRTLATRLLQFADEQQPYDVTLLAHPNGNADDAGQWPRSQ